MELGLDNTNSDESDVIRMEKGWVSVGHEKGQINAAKNIFQRLSNMGNETITAETSNWTEFTKTISSMNESIKCLQNEVRTIKRSRPDMTDDPVPGNKQIRLDSPESNSDEDIDCYLSNGEEKGASDGVAGEWEDISDFFVDEKDHGNHVPDTLATLVDKSLRCKTNTEKMKTLLEKYKRPENVKNLQVPKVDDILWNQLRPETKAAYFCQQTVQKVLCRALVHKHFLFKKGGGKR